MIGWRRGLATLPLLLILTGPRCGSVAERPAPDRRRSTIEMPILVPQNGHAQEVTAVAASPDRRRLATGGSDGTILLWDLERGRVLTSLAAAPGREVRALAFQGDHRIAFAEVTLPAAGSRIELWDFATNEAVRRFDGHPWSVGIGLALSADGALLAATGGGRLTIWETATGDLWAQLAAAGSDVTFLDDRRVVFQSGDSTVVLDLKNGPPALCILPTGTGQAFVVSQDGKTLAHAKGDQVTFWDLASATQIASQQLLTDAVILAFYDERGGLLAGDRTGSIYRLRGDRWKDLVGFLNLGAPVTGMAPLAGGKLVTTRRRDGTIFVWAVDAAAEVQRLGFPSPEVTTLDLSRDGSLLVVGDSAGTVRVWDMAAGADWIAAEPIQEGAEPSEDPTQGHVRETFHTGPVPFPARAPIRSTRLTPVGLLLVRYGGEVELWNLEFRQRNFQTKVPGATDALVREGECLIVAGSAEVQRFLLANGSELEPRAAPAGASALALAGDGKRLAVSGYDEVVVFDPQWNSLEHFSGLISGAGAHLYFLASGEALIRSSWSDTERLELATDQVIREPARSSRGAIAELRDVLLVGDRDGVVRGWMPGETRPRLEVSAHSAAVSALAVSGNGKVVVTGGADAALKVWQSDGMRLLANLQLLPRKDWLAFSPKGFFEGSPAGWSLAPFHYPSEPLHAHAPEQFFATFFQPGLLRDVLAAGKPIEEILAARRDARSAQRVETFRRSRIPEVRILSPRDTVEFETGRGSAGTWTLPGGRSLPSISPGALGSVRVTHSRVMNPVEVFEAEIRDTGSGVRDCRVFQNRALIHEQPGPFAVDASTRTGRMRLDFQVLAGPNELSVYCFNDANVRSEIVRVTVEGVDALKRRGKAYVVAAGGNGYRGGLLPLRYAEADAATTLTTLQASLEATGDYQVVPAPLRGKEATRRNLLAALERLAGGEGPPPGQGPAALQGLSRARLEDVVVIFFAGHGTAQDDRYILYPVDATGGPRLSGGITDRELEAALRKINAGHLVLILDTCQSGQILEAEERRRGPLNTRGFAQLAYEKRLQVLAASQSYQSAFEDTQFGHGLLTYGLIEDGLVRFLADSAPPDHILLSREWLRYTLRRVPELQGQVARARHARGEAFFPQGGARALRVQQPQVYLPESGADDLLIGARAVPPGTSP
jgi:WD40 repeat protein